MKSATRKKWIQIAAALVLLPLALIAIVFALPRPGVQIEPPRPAWWNYPAVEQAEYKTFINDDGKLRLQLVHPVLPGVTPAMIAWWYQNLPLGTATIDGKEYPYYHLFHLSEHGQIRVVKPAPDGTPGMAQGAIVYRQETFGPFGSKGQGRIVQFDEDGYVAIPIMGPLELGRVEHHFHAVTEGTLYTVNTTLGSDIPVLGSLLNLYIRHKQFAPPVVREWVRHQVEEVGSLPHFLPDLYARATSRAQADQ